MVSPRSRIKQALINETKLLPNLDQLERFALVAFIDVMDLRTGLASISNDDLEDKVVQLMYGMRIEGLAETAELSC